MKENITPITKEEVIKKQETRIPEIMIETVNKLLVQNYNKNTGKAIIKLSEIMDLVVGDADCGLFTREQIFKNHYLDFEPIYERKGWHVTYDKPGYNEFYEPFYIFK